MREIKFRQFYEGEMRSLGCRYDGVGQVGFSDAHYVDLGMHDEAPVGVLMQYTGLKCMSVTTGQMTDVYAGDILEVYDDRFVVEWDEDEAGFDARDVFDPDPVCMRLGEVLGYTEKERAKTYIIGNIYENPELLAQAA